MMECKWRADKKKNANPHPSTFVMMRPDLNMADLLYQKQQQDLTKKKGMVDEIN